MKLIVLTFDALQADDLQYLLNRPHFSRIKDKLAIVENLREVYPTLTYPIHTTMITGKKPNEHGIFHNQRADLYPHGNDFNIMGQNWYWEYEAINCETIFDIATKNGLKVGTSCWPVTAGAKNWLNVPEIWPTTTDKAEIQKLFEKSCSKDGYDKYYNKYISKYTWDDNSDMVLYSTDIAVDMLKKDNLDVLFCHAIILDHYRHVFGVYGKMSEEAITQMDMFTGKLLDILEETGELEDTSFVVLGDHGQIDIKTIFNINSAFVQKGLITLGEDNLPIDFKAYSFSAGFSTQIILKQGASDTEINEVYKVLCELKEEYPEYIQTVYTKDEILALEKLSGNFDFVVDGTYATVFGMKYNSDIVELKSLPQYSKIAATHGHHPNKGVKPPFVAFGPNVKAGQWIKNGDMTQVFPTLLNMLNLNAPCESESFDIFK